MKWLSLFMPLGFLVSCSSAPKYETKVQSVDIQKFMGQWYVIAGRFTPFEVDVYNAITIRTRTLNGRFHHFGRLSLII